MSDLTAIISDLSDKGLSSEQMKKMHLLAASAGTGKTYSIQSLYLRLILVEGLTVQQILVVTFTRDATKELRDRLQLVLREALDYVNGVVEIADAKDRTKRIVDEAVKNAGDGKNTVKHLLQLALLDFDMAAIYTINGFCQRVLNRFAFETGQAFDVQPTGDVSDEIDQRCRDWWRQHMYSIDEGLVGIINESGAFSLEAITTLARKIIAKPDAILLPEVKCDAEIGDKIKRMLKDFPGQEKETDKETAEFPGSLSSIRESVKTIQEQLKKVRDGISEEDWDKALSALLAATQFNKKIPDPCKTERTTLQDACIEFMKLVPKGTQARSFKYHENGCLQSNKCHGLTLEHAEYIKDSAKKLRVSAEGYIPLSLGEVFAKGKNRGQPTEARKSYELLLEYTSGQNVAAPELFDAIKEIAKSGAGIVEAVKVTADIVNPAFRKLADSLFEECRLSILCAALAVKSTYQAGRPTAVSASYDDFLVNLRDALTKDGSRLRSVLRNEFRAALIDEFQDTDPVQWGIFEKLFKGGDIPCFLVGDPKQAIYRFRNGDVETYLAATKDINEKHDLNVNYRSEKRLIDAVNQMFMDSDNRPTFGEGIEYKQPLGAAGKEKDKSLLLYDHKADTSRPGEGRIDQQPFKIILVGEDLTGKKSRSARAVYKLTAAEIARTLQPGRMSIGVNPVQRKDIAVLVNEHKQGEYIAEELKKLNIPSVRQGTGNVWDTDEGRALSVVLEAVLDSRNMPKVRHALLTSWCGLTAEQIQLLNKVDPPAVLQKPSCGLGDWVAVFEALRETWLKRGYPAMFRKMMGVFELKKRLLSANDGQGQRRLTNINHLSEIVEQKIVEERRTPEGILSWIRQQFDKSTAENSEEFRLRLETDDDAVRILTIFTSKGLEFPIVFAPTLFLMNVYQRGLPEYHEGCNLVIATNGDKEAKDREKEEMAREKVRQIYVAMTRAVHRTVIVAPNDGGKDGTPNKGEEQQYKMKGIFGEVLRLPMKKILENGQDKIVVDQGKVSERFSNVEGVESAIEVRESEPDGELTLNTTSALKIVAPGKEKPKPDTSKGHGSFSSLGPKETERTEEKVPVAGAASEAKDRDLATSPQSGGEIVERPQGIFAFPAGAKTGTCWHEIFEDLAFNAADDEIGKMVEEKLSIHGFLKNKERRQERIDLTAGMVKKVLRTTLPKIGNAAPFTLESILEDDRRTEWEFSFSALSGKKTIELRKAISGHDEYKPFTDALGKWDKEIPGGYLTGFVDLMFRKDKRYYIVDWKSNRRNGSQKDFVQKGLEEEMSIHGYWLQYLIYCVAVHQFLATALLGYEYEKHFGGVYYMFLRGVDGKSDPSGKMNGIYANRPPEELVEELSKILGDFS